MKPEAHVFRQEPILLIKPLGPDIPALSHDFDSVHTLMSKPVEGPAEKPGTNAVAPADGVDPEEADRTQLGPEPMAGDVAARAVVFLGKEHCVRPTGTAVPDPPFKQLLCFDF